MAAASNPDHTKGAGTNYIIMCLYAESSLAHRREVRGVQPGLLCVVDDIRPHRPLRARMFMFVRQECRCWLPQTAAKTPPGTGDRPSPTNAQELTAGPCSCEYMPRQPQPHNDKRGAYDKTSGHSERCRGRGTTCLRGGS